MLVKKIKGKVQGLLRASGLRVFRIKGLPHGTDFFIEITKKLNDADKAVTIFDVGANQGLFSKRFLNDMPGADIYCFEPVSESFNRLVSTIGKRPHIHFEQLGLGETDCELLININNLSVQNSITRVNNSSNKTEKIRITNIDNYCKQNAINEISLLKIDTEGYEMEVLKGAVGSLEAKKIRYIFIEGGFSSRNSWNTSFFDIYEFLKPYGYEIMGFYNQRLDKSSKTYLNLADILFVAV